MAVKSSFKNMVLCLLVPGQLGPARGSVCRDQGSYRRGCGGKDQ